ncbi:MAG: hypothetical protein U1E63_12095 [Burkholderiales bacterium]
MAKDGLIAECLGLGAEDQHGAETGSGQIAEGCRTLSRNATNVGLPVQ